MNRERAIQKLIKSERIRRKAHRNAKELEIRTARSSGFEKGVRRGRASASISVPSNFVDMVMDTAMREFAHTVAVSVREEVPAPVVESVCRAVWAEICVQVDPRQAAAYARYYVEEMTREITFSVELAPMRLSIREPLDFLRMAK